MRQAPLDKMGLSGINFDRKDLLKLAAVFLKAF